MGGYKNSITDIDGNVLINKATSTGDIFQVQGENNVFAARLDGSATIGQSYGLRVRGGTNSTDTSFLIENTSGTDLLIVKGNGNVGIGESNPSAKIHIKSPANARAIKLQNLQNNSASQITWLDESGTEKAYISNGSNLAGDADELAIGTAGSERMRIDSSGTTHIKATKAYGSQTATLRVQTIPTGTNFADGAFQNIVFGDESIANNYLGQLAVVQENASASTASTMRFYTNSGGGNGGTTERMRIDSSGNVGIGISPAAKLHLYTSANSDMALRIQNSPSNFYVGVDNTTGSRFIGSSGSAAYIGTTTSSPIEFATANTVRATIDSSGNVGIAAGGLIAGTITVGRNGNFSSLGAVSDGNATTTAFLNGYSTASGTSNAIIYTNGTYGSQTNTYGAIISDQRYKENIVDASPKLDKIMQVKVRNFNLIGDDLKQIGVIAQEVEQIFPSLVYERELTENIETVDEEGNVTSEIKPTGETAKAVKDSIFTYILLKAVQEQQEIINDLKARIEILENK